MEVALVTGQQWVGWDMLGCWQTWCRMNVIVFIDPTQTCTVLHKFAAEVSEFWLTF